MLAKNLFLSLKPKGLDSGLMIYVFHQFERGIYHPISGSSICAADVYTFYIVIPLHALDSHAGCFVINPLADS